MKSCQILFATQEKRLIILHPCPYHPCQPHHRPHTYTYTYIHMHTHVSEIPGIAYIFRRKVKLFYMHLVLFNNGFQDLLFGSKYLSATVTENNSRLS